jgi:hypothetical protein
MKKVVGRQRLTKIQGWLIVSLPLSLLMCAVQVKGQSGSASTIISQKPPPISSDKRSDDNSPLTTFEEEIKAKRLIKLAEKEHQENLKRAREISEIGQDLKARITDVAATSKPDPKKVERLEKLTRKIRGEAGGGDDDVQIVDAPADIPAAVNQIADAADQLSQDVQKTPRQVVSAAVIDRANVLLQLVKILRGFIH